MNVSVSRTPSIERISSLMHGEQLGSSVADDLDDQVE